MPMSARITNFAGGIVAEKRGGARQAFRHDPLGSTIAVISDAGTITATYNYWPYGEVRSSTGSATTPWKFCGEWGYYEGKDTTTYVRARVLKRDLARWMTVDPLWPEEKAYTYVECNPQMMADPSGKGKDPCNTSIVWDKMCSIAEGMAGGPCATMADFCHKHCERHGSKMKSCTETGNSVCGIWAMCCRCFCRCSVLDGDMCKPEDKRSECAKKTMEEWLFPKDPNSGYVRGNPHPNNGKPADCGKNSIGFHYQYWCRRKGTRDDSSYVITSRCCVCYENGEPKWKCETTRGCH